MKKAHIFVGSLSRKALRYYELGYTIYSLFRELFYLY